MATKAQDVGRNSFLLRFSIGIVCVAAIAIWALTTLDLRAIGLALAQIDLWTVIVHMPVLILIVWVLRAIRWHLVLLALDARPSFPTTYVSTAISLGLAAVTPMQSGEALKIAHARHQGVTAATAAGGFAIERLIDLLVLVALTFYASRALLMPGTNVALSALVVLAVGLIGGGGVLWIGFRYAPTLMDDFIRGARSLLARPILHIGIWTTTILCWLVSVELWRATLGGVGINTTFALSALLVGAVTLAGLALLVPGAIGVSEATVAAILAQQGLTPEMALTGALALRLISFIAIGLGGIHWGLARVARWANR